MEPNPMCSVTLLRTVSLLAHGCQKASEDLKHMVGRSRLVCVVALWLPYLAYKLEVVSPSEAA